MRAETLLSPEEARLLQPPDMEPVRRFVAAALQKKEASDAFHYKHIVAQLRERDDQETLWRVLVALTQHVSLLTAKPELYRELLSGLFVFNWRVDWRVSVALLSLVHQVAAANVLLLVPAFQLIAKSFGACEVELQDTSSGAVFGAFLSRPRDLLALLHRTLRSLLALSPSAQSELFPVLEANFPFKLNEGAQHRAFVTHLLVVCQYLPVQQARLLELIIVRCTEMDAEIHIEDSGEVRIRSEEGDAEEGGEGVFDEPGPTSSLNSVNEYAQKLDDMLLLLLQFFEGRLAEEGGRERLFQQLFRIFETHLLLVHKSKFVQFLLFYLTARDARFAVAFPKQLLALFLDEQSAPLKRQSAVVYLASFLARANFVPLSLVRWTVGELLRWCHGYVLGSSGCLGVTVLPRFGASSGAAAPALEYDELGRLTHTDTGPAALLEKHAALLCCVQAVCYVLCFYGADLAEAQRDKDAREQWECVLSCSLAPLRHCAPPIRAEFVRLLRHEQLLGADVMDLIPQEPKPTVQPAAILVAGRPADLTAQYRSRPAAAASELEAFFPFDPCLLAGLCLKVEPHYREWRGIPGVDFSQEAAADGEETEEEEDLDSVASSLVSMSIASAHETHTRASSYAMSSGNESVWGGAMHEAVETEALRDTGRLRRPRQYSVGSTGSW